MKFVARKKADKRVMLLMSKEQRDFVTSVAKQLNMSVSSMGTQIVLAECKKLARKMGDLREKKIFEKTEGEVR